MDPRRALAAALAVAALTSYPAPAREVSGEAKKDFPGQTISGEIIDTRCYLEDGRKGSDHQQCATLCAKDGIPAGLLTADGKVFVLIVPPSALAQVMALQAEVTGTVHGEALIPDSIKVKKGSAWQEIKLPKHM